MLDKFYLLYIIWTFLHKWNSVTMVETEKVHSLKLTKHRFKFLKFRKSLHTATWLRETEIAVRISCWLERVMPCIVDVCISLITRLAHQIIVLTYKKFKKLAFVVHQKVCSTNFCHYDRDKNRMYSVSPWFWFLFLINYFSTIRTWHNNDVRKFTSQELAAWLQRTEGGVALLKLNCR